MRSRTRWSAPVGIGLTLALTGAAGCGGSSSNTEQSSEVTPAVATLVAAVPDKTTQAGTARVSFTANTQVSGQAVAFIGSGVFDFARHSGRLSFSIPALLGNEAVKAIVTPRTLYVQIPRIGQAGMYYRIDLRELGGGDSPLAALGYSDPTAGLEALRGVSSDVHEVGPATVRGEPTTHYQGTIDAARAVVKAPPFLRDRVRGLFRQVKTFPFDVYVDAEGRLRKLTEHIAIPASSATKGQSVTVDLTFELSDFGLPVSVTAPPKDQQADGAQLLRQFGGGGQ